MHLDGSCHCKSVRFSAQSSNPVPYQLCYCEICRKTAGSGGFAINLGAKFETLKIDGAKNIRVYVASFVDSETGETTKSSGERSFCVKCGSALWLWDPNWPKLVHPHASAIDTPLPIPPERTHLMLGSKANWVEPVIAEGDRQHEVYPEESITEWHKRTHMTQA
jgi:hypothetical protein